MEKKSRTQKNWNKCYNNKKINKNKIKNTNKKYLILGIAAVIVFICAVVFGIEYYEKGYYINNMNVEVDINDKKQYSVTEIIDVHYYAKKHGINRIFGSSLSSYNYEINDIKVDGAPFKRQYDSPDTIRIGDPNTSVTGDKRYVISYTINHSDSGLDNNSILDLDILGNQWDTKVKNFSAKINYPSNSGINKIRVSFDKRTGHKTYIYKEDKSLLKYEEKDNSLLINSVKTIPANKGIKVKAIFSDDLFKSIPVALPNRSKTYYNSTNEETEYSFIEVFYSELRAKIDKYFGLVVFIVFIIIGFLCDRKGGNSGNHYDSYYDGGSSGDFGGGSSDGGGSGGGSSW